MERKNPPYIYDQYMFYFFSPRSSQNKNILSRCHSALVEAFNRRYHLPRYIIVVLDKDVIESVNFFDYGQSTILGHIVHWISKELQNYLSTRSEQLYAKKAGSVYPGTRVIWVKMIPRKGLMENFTNHEMDILSGKDKFNAILDEIAERKRNNHVINIISLENHHFDQYSCLNHQGKLQYWKEIDYLVKKFDRKEIQLTPQEVLRCKNRD